MVDNQQSTRFLKYLVSASSLAAAAQSAAVNDQAGNAILYSTLRAQFGNDFNTLIVLNLDAVPYQIILDGEAITVVSGSSGSFNIEARDGVIYNHLEYKNMHASTAGVAGTLFFTVGRTGV